MKTSSTDWRYTVAEWNVNVPKALLTSLGNNKYKLTLKPSINAWYGVPTGEQVLKMAFVFRNSDGSKSGRNANGSDILVDVYQGTMTVNIVLPSGKSLFLKQNDSIPVSAISPTAETMKILIDNALVKTSAGNRIADTNVKTKNKTGKLSHSRQERSSSR